MMGDESLAERVPGLSDLELAVLLCLIADQHCIIHTDADAVDSLTEELKLISSRIFGLSSAVLDCSASTTLEDFGSAILVNEYPTDSFFTPAPTPRMHEASYSSSSKPNASPRPELRSPNQNLPADSRTMANVVIAKNLDSASHDIQLQALELLRRKRIVTGLDAHSAPLRFMFVAILAGKRSGPRLKSHLNDHILMSHYHSPEDGFPNLEEVTDRPIESDADSTSSVVRKSSMIEFQGDDNSDGPLYSNEDLDKIVSQRKAVSITMDVKRYIQDIIVFLRMHRAMGGGMTTQSTRHMELLVKCLAPLHSMQYVTPSLVALAARKVYPHRITICTPENERSTQWGSDIKAVSAMLNGLNPEDLIEAVLSTVEVPL